MKELTARQREILDFISRSIQERGYPPTIREIGAHMGIRSTNGVNDHLKALERKGYLRRDDLKSRAMRPTHMINESIHIPIFGDVAAGAPILAVDRAESAVKMDRLFMGNHEDLFGLRVKGDSMIDEGIYNGDFVFVRRTAHAERGAIVIALIEGEATCKRYYPEGDRVRFQPANAGMAPIYISQADFKETMILGEVVGLYRRYR
ncbi:transcriptional repressor LexA [Myxococcota bacterium]|nr:transcriptional repressor LexA [Myxococcota bacterium]MBU1431020.1 transcriptional repressor LexA [Myxococcota bacterium]MBU1900486.1 transcriptional repressor LexA [Myxococcota bacterium]